MATKLITTLVIKQGLTLFVFYILLLFREDKTQNILGMNKIRDGSQWVIIVVTVSASNCCLEQIIADMMTQPKMMTEPAHCYVSVKNSLVKYSNLTLK